MKKSQARGYLLEIVLSKLIEINGYEIIKQADGNEIVSKPNGLNVRGRGGFHQFDTLGKFKITPPFIYPLRLFVEAKFYDVQKVGIDRVRMGVGILEDVNTNYSTVTMNDEELSVERYQYHYAIFSTSGFTEDAQRFAIAHKIHLIDLRCDEYKTIIEPIREIVEVFSQRSDDIPKEKFSLFREYFFKVINEEIDERDESVYIQELRNEIPDLNRDISEELVEKIIDLKKNIAGQLIYLATGNSPYIIPLFSNKDVNEILKKNPHQDVAITWEENSNKWTITFNNEQTPIIKFTLPEILYQYMISDKNRIGHNARNIKNNQINRLVFIAYLDNYNPTLCTLKFNNEFTKQIVR